MPISTVRPAASELVRVLQDFHTPDTDPSDRDHVVGRTGGWLVVPRRFARQLAADGLAEIFDGTSEMLRHVSRSNVTGSIERDWRDA